MRTGPQTCCPHKSVSLYIPIFEHGKKVSPFNTITANQTQSDGAEIVEDLWEESETGVGVCEGKAGRVEDVGRVG